MPAWRVLGAQRLRLLRAVPGAAKAVGSGLPGKEATPGYPRQRRRFPERRLQEAGSYRYISNALFSGRVASAGDAPTPLVTPRLERLAPLHRRSDVGRRARQSKAP